MMELPIRWYFLNPDTDPNNPPKGPRGECIFGWASGYLVGERIFGLVWDRQIVVFHTRPYEPVTRRTSIASNIRSGVCMHACIYIRTDTCAHASRG